MVKINAGDFDFGKARAAQQLPERADDVACADAARACFGQHRREQKKVLAVEQRDVHITLAPKPLLQFERGIESGESAAGDYNLSCCHLSLSRRDKK